MDKAIDARDLEMVRLINMELGIDLRDDTGHLSQPDNTVSL
jgi:hypothetical protein